MHCLLFVHLNLKPLCLKFEATMFRAVFLSAFFGFLRVGEFAVSSKSHGHEYVLSHGDLEVFQSGQQSHVVDLTFRQSKNNQRGPPQRIRLVQSSNDFLCPVRALMAFIAIRPQCLGPFFCHFDGTPLTRYQFNSVLKRTVSLAGLKEHHIRGHSFRIGAASSASALGLSQADIRSMGRWRSNAVLSYIRTVPTCNLNS